MQELDGRQLIYGILVSADIGAHNADLKAKPTGLKSASAQVKKMLHAAV